MPNAKILSEKQAIVASLTEKFQNAAAGVIVMRLTEGASLVSFAAVSPEDEESYGAEQAGQTEDAETPESAADENG